MFMKLCDTTAFRGIQVKGLYQMFGILFSPECLVKIYFQIYSVVKKKKHILLLLYPFKQGLGKVDQKVECGISYKAKQDRAGYFLQPYDTILIPMQRPQHHAHPVEWKLQEQD